MTRRHDAAAQMTELLHAEAAALRSANFPELDRIVARKEAMLASMPVHLTEVQILRLRGLAQRNERLLEACRSGFKSALRQIQTIASPVSELKTYGPTGRRMSSDASSVERRA